MKNKILTSLALACIVMLGAAHGASAQTFSLLSGGNLTVGSRGQAVVELQGILAELGYLTLSAPTGYFGPLTRSAVARYQQALGVPNTGYFGPLTRAGMTADFSSRGWMTLLGATPSQVTIVLNVPTATAAPQVNPNSSSVAPSANPQATTSPGCIPNASCTIFW